VSESGGANGEIDAELVGQLGSTTKPSISHDAEVKNLLGKLARISPQAEVELVEASSGEVVLSSAENLVQPPTQPNVRRVAQVFRYFVTGQWDKLVPDVWTPERAAGERLGCLAEVKRHRVVLSLLLCLALSLKTILVWLLFVTLWTVCEKIYPLMPQPLKTWCDRSYAPVLNRMRDSGIYDELEEAVSYTRPFIIFSLYLFFTPVALAWIGCHWCRQVFAENQGGRQAPAISENVNDTAGGGDFLVFVQNRSKDTSINQVDFFHSPAFAITAVTLFGAGLPAALTLGLYRYLQIDAMLGYPSRDPQFFWVIVVICFYFTSFAWCASVLFFRAWFTFPLNFLSSEHELELNQKRIRRRSHKGWFLSVLTMNNPAVGTSSIDWDDVTTVEARNATGTNFYPLPEAAFRGAPPIFERVLNKIAMFYDSVSHKIDRSQLITISTARGEAGWGREIDINLSELSAEERARLFYAIRKWAPLAQVSESAQTSMIGSCVMKEPKYTEIWFDLLTQKHDSKNAGRTRLADLKCGDTLRQGQVRVIERLASGGQATAYLARYESMPPKECSQQLALPPGESQPHHLEEETAAQPPHHAELQPSAQPLHQAGEPPTEALISGLQCQSHICVLKEFILSDSDAVGALIQSAAEFEVEASLLSRLDHPRVVKLLDCFSEDRRVYLVLQYVSGKSLRQIVKEGGPLAPNKVIDIALQLCDVVAYLHGQNPPLVHRDLAPDNIMYDEELGVKLIDFSLACTYSRVCAGAAAAPGAGQGNSAFKIFEKSAGTNSVISPATSAATSPATSAATSTGHCVGKQAYTPPEQFREEVTVQSDIYALGATMYFLLTGQDPKALTRSNPASKNPAVPEALCRIVERATELDLARRYEEISWLRLDLEGH